MGSVEILDGSGQPAAEQPYTMHNQIRYTANNGATGDIVSNPQWQYLAYIQNGLSYSFKSYERMIGGDSGSEGGPEYMVVPDAPVINFGNFNPFDSLKTDTDFFSDEGDAYVHDIPDVDGDTPELPIFLVKDNVTPETTKTINNGVNDVPFIINPDTFYAIYNDGGTYKLYTVCLLYTSDAADE